MILNNINFDWGGWNIFCNCVDKLGGGEESDTFKKVRDSTVYRMI